MKFQAALAWMQVGKKVFAPGFIGYWYWDKDAQEIIIVTKENERFPMAESNNWPLTLGFLLGDEWELYNGPDDPRESDKYKQVMAERQPPSADQGMDLDRLK